MDFALNYLFFYHCRNGISYFKNIKTLILLSNKPAPRRRSKKVKGEGDDVNFVISEFL